MATPVIDSAAGNLTAGFAQAMARLGPFGPAPLLCVAVSGGADSTCLALLTQNWSREKGGTVLALILDHGLRSESACEATLTAQRLAARGIASRILAIPKLATGGNLQQRARQARHHALAQAANQAGCAFLLLGHHAADQSETVAMRAARGSSGLEAMATRAARHAVILLRPLLGMPPADLRAYLKAAGMAWVEDPSNTNRAFERVRMRQASRQILPDSPQARQQREADTARFLANHAILAPEGYVFVTVPAVPAATLAAVLRMIAGADYAPAQEAVSALAASLRPVTLGGVQIAAYKSGWLLAREPAACAAAIPAVRGVFWDNRFELDHQPDDENPSSFGALGADSVRFRQASVLPALVLRGLPCLRQGGKVTQFPVSCRFIPAIPAAPAIFFA